MSLWARRDHMAPTSFQPTRGGSTPFHSVGTIWLPGRHGTPPFPGHAFLPFSCLFPAPLPTRLLAPLFPPCPFRSVCIGRAAHRTRFFRPHPFSMLMLPLQRSRSSEYIGAVFLHLPDPVALTLSLSSRHLRKHHLTPFPGSCSSSGEHV